MKKLLTVFAVLSLAVPASADFTKVGSAGAQFLKIGVGSRYQAMGEAGVATTNDAYAMYWNPAGLASVEASTVSFTNVNWFLDVGLNYFGYARNFEDVGVFGVSATILSMGNVEVTTFEQQEGTGDFYSASSYALGLSFARQLTTQFAFGTTIKYVGERISSLRSSSLAFDFGTQLETGFRS
jgi:Type IX secretion system protein PorV